MWIGLAGGAAVAAAVVLSKSNKGPVSGTLASQRAFSGTAMLVGFAPFTFSGTFDTGVASLSVVVNGSGFDNATLVFNRQ